MGQGCCSIAVVSQAQPEHFVVDGIRVPCVGIKSSPGHRKASMTGAMSLDVDSRQLNSWGCCTTHTVTELRKHLRRVYLPRNSIMFHAAPRHVQSRPTSLSGHLFSTRTSAFRDEEPDIMRQLLDERLASWELSYPGTSRSQHVFKS